MTGEEVSRRYNIPPKILQEYRSWGLCGAVQLTIEDWQYDDRDLERLGMIMALHDMGFSAKEVENYVKLMLAGACTKVQRMQILSERRSKTLDEIHLRERQLERMDYLRNEIRNHEGGNENE